SCDNSGRHRGLLAPAGAPAPAAGAARAGARSMTAGVALLAVALRLALGDKEAAAAMLLQDPLAIHLLGKAAQHLLKPFALAQFDKHPLSPFIVLNGGLAASHPARPTGR